MNLMALIRMFTIRFRMEGAIGVVLLLLGLLGGVGVGVGGGGGVVAGFFFFFKQKTAYEIST